MRSMLDCTGGLAARPAARMEWSTKPCHSNRPFGNWADNLAAALVRMEPRKISDDLFEGMISRVDAAPIQISLVKATKHTVLRLHSHIVGGTDDLCLINLQLEGLGCTTQRGQEQVSAHGDLAVADTTEPYEIANRRDFKLFCFAVPRSLLPSGFFGRPRLNLSMTEIGRALSRTLAGYAELCLNSPPGAGVPAPIGAQVVALISHVPGLLAEAPAERANALVLLSMMLDYIDRHSDDPDLGAATLAAKFNCSPRYVHRLFAGTGRSVGEHVNEKRILVCTRNLLDRTGRRRTIAENAMSPAHRNCPWLVHAARRGTGCSPAAHDARGAPHAEHSLVVAGSARAGRGHPGRGPDRPCPKDDESGSIASRMVRRSAAAGARRWRPILKPGIPPV
jgi:AraC family transcriptional regulator, positive regulator of tynA and feaB